jgi:YgiT-type zinc finger domain-containing protein
MGSPLSVDGRNYQDDCNYVITVLEMGMTGELENDRCYFCGGKLEPRSATIPFVMNGSVVVVKSVPAEVCSQCGEAIMSSPVARRVDTLLKQVYRLNSEVSIIAYSDPMPEAA